MRNFSQISLLQFLRSPQFTKALVLTFGIVAAVFFFGSLQRIDYGISAAIGILLTSASDVAGPLRKKVTAILLAICLIVIGTAIIFTAAAISPYVLVPALLIFTFFVSFLSVYGFRASLISFSGLLAGILAMAGLQENPIYVHAFFIALGGLWYLFLSLINHFFNPKKQADHFLAECFELTADYLEIRAQLVAHPQKRKPLLEKLFFLQNDINEKHEALRELLISTRKTSGSSVSQREKLYIFIELVDILELAMANPVDYEKMDHIFSKQKNLLKALESLVLEMANQLRNQSLAIGNKQKGAINGLQEKLMDLENALINFKKGQSWEAPHEDLIILQNIYDYQERQLYKITLIDKIRKNKGFPGRKIKDKEAEKFITPEEYSLKTFTENFTFSSPIFKHSLRLTAVVLIGWVIGQFFELQNVYWILLTIVVILRPNYGLTKERSQQRIIGTIFGAIVASGIVFLVQDKVVYAVLAIISFLLAFSLVQKNYKWAAGFITLNVVFIYALLSPNAYSVIQFRVLDTVLGAGLAYLGILFLWPSWEHRSIDKLIVESLKANKGYLIEIGRFYTNKKEIPTEYRVSRKTAFLAMGNLSAAFQRMTQEPKGQQMGISKFYELLVLNHAFLSSAASLGTYIQNHATTAASEHFKNLLLRIQQNLDQAIAQLESAELHYASDEKQMRAAQEYLSETYSDLKLNPVRAEAANRQNKYKPQLQEVQLVISQVKWLLEVSEKLQKIAKPL